MRKTVKKEIKLFCGNLFSRKKFALSVCRNFKIFSKAFKHFFFVKKSFKILHTQGLLFQESLKYLHRSLNWKQLKLRLDVTPTSPPKTVTDNTRNWNLSLAVVNTLNWYQNHALFNASLFIVSEKISSFVLGWNITLQLYVSLSYLLSCASWNLPTLFSPADL